MESIYQQALLIELKKYHLIVGTEKEVIASYEGEKAGGHRLDILVEGKVIVGLKTVEELSKAHYAQVRQIISFPYRKYAGLL